MVSDEDIKRLYDGLIMMRDGHMKIIGLLSESDEKDLIYELMESNKLIKEIENGE